MKKTILCLLLALGLLLLSAAAMAASAPDINSFNIDDGSITIKDGTNPGTIKVLYGDNENKDNIAPKTTIYIGGACPQNNSRLSIETQVPVKIRYLVQLGSEFFTYPMSIDDNADVTLELDNTDHVEIYGTIDQPAITLGSGSKLTLENLENSTTSLRLRSVTSAISGPTDINKPAATVILNSGVVAIDSDSGSGIEGNVNLVINGGTFKANNTPLIVKNLIVTGGELWAGSYSSTKVTYQYLSEHGTPITCRAGILPFDSSSPDNLYVFGNLTLPVDLTIPRGKSLGLKTSYDSSLTIPKDTSLTCNRLIINQGTTLTNNGTLTINHSSDLFGEMTNTGTLIINNSLRMNFLMQTGSLNNNGTIGGSGCIDPRLNHDPSLTVKSIENGTVTLSVPANANATAQYSLDKTNWKDEPEFTGGIPTEGRTFYARYKENNFFKESGETSITVYPVSLDANDGTIASGKDVGYCIAGQSTPLPAKDDMTRLNYTFEGWYDNETLTGNPVTEITKKDNTAKTFWAKWTPDSYTVTLNVSGGTINSGNVTGYTYGVGATLPTDVTRENYFFDGWYANEALTGDPVTAIGANETGKREYWAKWTPDSYTVTLNVGGGTINSGNVTGYTHGVGAKLPTDVTREHYTFGGWFDNSIFTGTPFTEIASDATTAKVFWAKWTPDTYSLTLNANGGTINSGNLTSYTYGEHTMLPTDVTRPDYTFGGWFDDETFSGKSYVYLDSTETGDKTLWAYWMTAPYKVTLNVSGGTINSGNVDKYYFGYGATLPTDVTRAGYTFAGWYDNEALTGEPVAEIAREASGDLSFWAKWRVVLTAPDGAIVSGGDAFAKLPPVTAPTLVLPDGQTLGPVTLKYETVGTSRENTAVYEVYLVDQDGNRVKLPFACTLCLPYPEGLSQSSASTYRIHILHEMDGGRSEDFDSVSGSLELTAQGLCVRISSLSPFTITWERFPEVNLPQTGDTSRPGLWLALALASAATLAILLRGRKTA